MPPIKARKVALPGEEPGAESIRFAKQLIPPLDVDADSSLNRKSAVRSQTAVEDAFGAGEGMRKLRIPTYLSSHLPSIRKYAPSLSDGKTDVIDLSDDPDEIVMQVNQDRIKDVRNPKVTVNGGLDYQKFKATNTSKDSKSFNLTLLDHITFDSLIFDVGYTSHHMVLISCDSGTHLFPPISGKASLQSKRKPLKNIIQGGGVSSFLDGRILVICRNQDSANLYTAEGLFVRRFYCGTNPVSCAVTPQDYILISDTGEKCIRVFSSVGKELYQIGNKQESPLRWPQYLTPGMDCAVHVSDTHHHRVFTYNDIGECRAEDDSPSRVKNNGRLIQPAGLCHRNGRLMICDQLTGAVESYDSITGNHETTILGSQQGKLVRPRSISFSTDGVLLIGGVTTSVWLFMAMPQVITLD